MKYQIRLDITVEAKTEESALTIIYGDEGVGLAQAEMDGIIIQCNTVGINEIVDFK